jgi:sodium/potassium-transporting ATPase subunit alpha
MATLITNGTGKGIVTQTGSNTMIGSIAVLTSSAKQEKTTLQKEINKFVTLIATLAISTVSVCFLCWGVWIYQKYPTFITVPAMLVNAIAILVAFIPTGLPVAVTLSLLLVAKKMARNRVLVKNLTVIETLSCCNVIASDKTGTLTQNKMSVVNACAGLTPVNVNIVRRSSFNSAQNFECKASLQLLNACVICNESQFLDEDKTKPVSERGASGCATDIAILNYCASIIDVNQIAFDYQMLDTQIGVCPFISKNRWSARVFKPNKIERKNDCFKLDHDECAILMKGNERV